MNANKTLYVETDSAETDSAKVTGLFRNIIGDAFDADERAKQYKGKRRQDFFGHWELPPGVRDYLIHTELKRPYYSDRVIWRDPKASDVQSKEVFDFIVDKNSTVAEMKQVVIDLISEVVLSIGGESKVKTFIPTTWQRDAIRFVARALSEGKTTLMLELAARFGKTGTSVCMFDYSSADVMVVTNYVKTVNKSFGNTVVDFFADRMVYVDARSKNAESMIDSALANGKKVVLACSLHHSQNLDPTIDMIRKYDNRLVFVDEADFGCHKDKQVSRVKRLRENVPLILMTGTGADKAAATHHIEGMLSTTYFDMLLQTNKA